MRSHTVIDSPVGPLTLVAENDAIVVGKLNVDENPVTATKFDILSIPTLLVFVGGEPVGRIVGAKSPQALASELAKWIG